MVLFTTIREHSAVLARRAGVRAGIHRTTVLAVLLATAILPGRAAADPGYTKYYVTASAHAGKPERLDEIAARFLGGTGRAGELAALNPGRGPAAALPAGTPVRLPFDAYGYGVHYGLLPARPAATGPCRSAPRQGTPSGWALDRVGAPAAWARTRGEGVLVAVLDSGVASRVPGMAGRLAPAADVTTGRTAPADCTGTGTAMAGIIAAGTGLAPAAAVLPVRVVDRAARAAPWEAAAGIEVAVSAGARVLALGADADLGDPAVREAIAGALAHDVVVVTGPAATAGDAGLLRVAGVDEDGHAAQPLPGTEADLTAPGVAVAAPDAATGDLRPFTGTRYAVAYVAGAAVLVRAAHPELSAAQTVRRLRASAQPGTAGPALDAGRAVTAAVAAGPAGPEPGGVRWWWLAAGAAVAALLAGAFVVRRRG